MYVSLSVCVCVRACVRACVLACVRVYEHAYVHIVDYIHIYICTSWIYIICQKRTHCIHFVCVLDIQFTRPAKGKSAGNRTSHCCVQ